MGSRPSSPTRKDIMDKIIIKTLDEIQDFSCDEPIVILQQISDDKILIVTRAPIEMIQMAQEIQTLRERLAFGGSALQYVEEVLVANPNADESLLEILRKVRDILKGKMEDE